MHIHIDIDDRVLKQAMRLTGLRSGQAVIERALAELVKHKSRAALADAFGRYPTDFDPEAFDESPEWVANTDRP